MLSFSVLIILLLIHSSTIGYRIKKYDIMTLLFIYSSIIIQFLVLLLELYL